MADKFPNDYLNSKEETQNCAVFSQAAPSLPLEIIGWLFDSLRSRISRRVMPEIAAVNKEKNSQIFQRVRR